MQRTEPIHPIPGCTPAAVVGVRAGKVFAATDWVADEVPVALEYNGISHAVMMASPADLEDFARGFSLTEGIVDTVGQIRDIELVVSEQGHTLQIQIAAGCFARLKDRRRNLTGRTGCGLCGTDSLAHAVRRPAPVAAPAAPFDIAAVARALAALRSQQHLLDATGATHAAAWCHADGAIALVREDVGRHNALDKLVGALHVADVAAASGFIVVTSRASFEMVQKAACAGVALLAAISGVTALAIDVAQGAGISLLGFARGDNASVYSHPEHIALDCTP
ncbi:MAG: formate dehydrogenase accessory sulfurtransferase FdhD [Rhodoferax sp.]|uniref:formate dehydrogenase accessory sulfurtransferase FdhD n=1 Tax=Rhodoferax sp. TaxID=50421 RepID=UPI003267994F